MNRDEPNFMEKVFLTCLMVAMTPIVAIGGGLVAGCQTAWKLAREGALVTVAIWGREHEQG